MDSGIKFQFIYARPPHFGGIWEVGIKSFKHHFRRIMAFSVDQFHTVVTQVEAVLNSRPYHPLIWSPSHQGIFWLGNPSSLSPNQI